jgi:hypothetical protein
MSIKFGGSGNVSACTPAAANIAPKTKVRRRKPIDKA